jgi:energy-coupling factor transport system permease protein
MSISFGATATDRPGINVDPRPKLLQIVLTAIFFFTNQVWASIVAYALSIVLVMLLFRMWRTVFKYVVLMVTAWGVLAVLEIWAGDDVYHNVYSIFALLMRLLPFVMLGEIMINTVAVTDLIAALSKMHLPRVVIVPLAVTLRFIPTIQQELRYIRNAMSVRGIHLTCAAVLRRPLQMIEYVLVPLLFRSSRIAEELAASAMTRAIDYPCVKTTLRELRLGIQDAVYFLYVILVFTAGVTWQLILQ